MGPPGGIALSNCSYLYFFFFVIGVNYADGVVRRVFTDSDGIITDITAVGIHSPGSSSGSSPQGPFDVDSGIMDATHSDDLAAIEQQ